MMGWNAQVYTFNILGSCRYLVDSLLKSPYIALLLAPQRGAHSIGAFRDPIPSHPLVAFEHLCLYTKLCGITRPLVDHK